MSEPSILRTLRMSHNKSIKEVAEVIELMEFEYMEIEEGKRAVSDDQCDILEEFYNLKGKRCYLYILISYWEIGQGNLNTIDRKNAHIDQLKRELWIATNKYPLAHPDLDE